MLILSLVVPSLANAGETRYHCIEGTYQGDYHAPIVSHPEVEGDSDVYDQLCLVHIVGPNGEETQYTQIMRASELVEVFKYNGVKKSNTSNAQIEVGYKQQAKPSVSSYQYEWRLSGSSVEKEIPKTTFELYMGGDPTWVWLWLGSDNNWIFVPIVNDVYLNAYYVKSNGQLVSLSVVCEEMKLEANVPMNPEITVYKEGGMDTQGQVRCKTSQGEMPLWKLLAIWQYQGTKVNLDNGVVRFDPTFSKIANEVDCKDRLPSECYTFSSENYPRGSNGVEIGKFGRWIENYQYYNGQIFDPTGFPVFQTGEKDFVTITPAVVGYIVQIGLIF